MVKLKKKRININSVEAYACMCAYVSCTCNCICSCTCIPGGPPMEVSMMGAHYSVADYVGNSNMNTKFASENMSA